MTILRSCCVLVLLLAAGCATSSENSTGETPTTATPTSETPTGETPTTATPTSETPTGETPTTATPTSETPTGETPTTATPTSEVPTSETPTTATPTSENPTSETPTTATPTGEIPTGETQTVRVVFGLSGQADCTATMVVERSVPEGVEPLRAALEALAEGPSADEAAAGAYSMLGPGAVEVIGLDEGLALVDLDEIPPNASASCGSMALVAQLAGTAGAVEGVEWVRLRLAGDCAALWNALQGECVDVAADGTTRPVPLIEQAVWSGCNPGEGPLPDGRWFGSVVTVDETELIVDLACWFTGTAAARMAENAGEESPPPNDYWVLDDSDHQRSVPVADRVEVIWFPDIGDPTGRQVDDLATWAAARGQGPVDPMVWLTVAGGELVVIEEQWVP